MKPLALDLVEVAGIVLLVTVATWSLAARDALAGRAVTDELAPFLALYGPPLYSSHEEELFIRDWFQDRRDGAFLDVGAGHYRDRSNTYYLERHLGWSGIAIDALARFAADYVTHRPRTRFFPLFVSDVSDARARLFVGSIDLFSSADRGFVAAWGEVDAEHEVPTITLDDLLAREGVERIDLLSMDIELSEPKALAGFDLQRYRPELACIEAHPQVRQAILDYFHARGYVVVGRYLRADPQNLWFAPAE